MRYHFFEAVDDDGRRAVLELARLLHLAATNVPATVRLLRNSEQPERLLIVVETSTAIDLPATPPQVRCWTFEDAAEQILDDQDVASEDAAERPNTAPTSRREHASARADTPDADAT